MIAGRVVGCFGADAPAAMLPDQGGRPRSRRGRGPAKLGAQVHLDAQGRIDSIVLANPKATDADLAPLAGLDGLESLEIVGRRDHRRRPGPPQRTDVPGAALPAQRRCDRRRAETPQRPDGPGSPRPAEHEDHRQGAGPPRRAWPISKCSTWPRPAVADDDLAHLEKLTQIETLSLEGTRVTRGGPGPPEGPRPAPHAEPQELRRGRRRSRSSLTGLGNLRMLYVKGTQGDRGPTPRSSRSKMPGPGHVLPLR